MYPTLSYTIWFSQRTGSTLLCKALEATGIAGRPAESLGEEMLSLAPGEAQQRLWQLSSTANGVCGYKHSFYEPYFNRLIEWLRGLPGDPLPPDAARAAVWERAFPHHRHIFMTRRNKVRLAVSWWKAIQSEEWHREAAPGITAPGAARRRDLLDAYHFDAINQLYAESVMREAGAQEFFSEGAIAPLTVVYEDFILDYEGTVRRVLAYLGLDDSAVNIAPPHFSRLADEVSEAWAQRFRQERQASWDNRGW